MASLWFTWTFDARTAGMGAFHQDRQQQNNNMSHTDLVPAVGNSSGSLMAKTGHETPGAGHETPKNGHETPRNGDVTPRTGNVTPMTGHVSPRNGDVTPRTGHVTPRLGHVTPRNGDVTPRTGHVTPRLGHVTPRLGDVTPRTGHVTPRTGHVTPRGNHVTPRSGHVTPRSNSAATARTDIIMARGEPVTPRTVSPVARGDGPITPRADPAVVARGDPITPRTGSAVARGGDPVTPRTEPVVARGSDPITPRPDPAAVRGGPVTTRSVPVTVRTAPLTTNTVTFLQAEPPKNTGEPPSAVKDDAAMARGDLVRVLAAEHLTPDKTEPAADRTGTILDTAKGSTTQSTIPGEDVVAEAVTFLGLLRHREDELTERTKHLMKRDRRLVQLLFCTTVEDWTPLHACTLRGARKLVKMALKCGAPPDLEMGQPEGLPGRCSPLHLAAHRGDVSLLQVLVQGGASVSKRDAAGRTPLFYAASNGNSLAARKLIKYGADLSDLSPEQRALYKEDIDRRPVSILCIPVHSSAAGR